MGCGAGRRRAAQICQRKDGTDHLLGEGAYGRVYKGVRGDVQDVAIKQVCWDDPPPPPPPPLIRHATRHDLLESSLVLKILVKDDGWPTACTLLLPLLLLPPPPPPPLPLLRSVHNN